MFINKHSAGATGERKTATAKSALVARLASKFPATARLVRNAAFASMLLAEGCAFGPNLVSNGVFRVGDRINAGGRNDSIVLDHCFIGLRTGAYPSFVRGAELRISGCEQPLRLFAGDDTTIASLYIRCSAVSQDLKSARIEVYK